MQWAGFCSFHLIDEGAGYEIEWVAWVPTSGKHWCWSGAQFCDSMSWRWQSRGNLFPRLMGCPGDRFGIVPLAQPDAYGLHLEWRDPETFAQSSCFSKCSAPEVQTGEIQRLNLRPFWSHWKSRHQVLLLSSFACRDEGYNIPSFGDLTHARPYSCQLH